MLNIALAIKFLEKNNMDSNMEYVLMAGVPTKVLVETIIYFPREIRTPTFLSKASIANIPKDGCPSSAGRYTPLLYKDTT